jgi:hypothetical protein
MVVVTGPSGYCDISTMSGMMEMLDFGARGKGVY